MYNEESIWSKGLRIAAWIYFFAGIGSSFAMARNVGFMFGEPARWGEPARMDVFMFIVTFIAFFILTFITTAFIMIFLDMARDISATNYNTSIASRDIADIKKFLADKHGGVSASSNKPSIPTSTPILKTYGEWRCPVCDEKNASNAFICKGCGKHK